MSILSAFSTKMLVEELERREGVSKTTAEPYEDKSVEVSGPAIVLVVTD